MNSAVRRFLEAHDRYLALQNARMEVSQPEQREHLHVEILRAYLEVQMRAKFITGLQYANGNDFAEMN